MKPPDNNPGSEADLEYVHPLYDQQQYDPQFSQLGMGFATQQQQQQQSHYGNFPSGHSAGVQTMMFPQYGMQGANNFPYSPMAMQMAESFSSMETSGMSQRDVDMLMNRIGNMRLQQGGDEYQHLADHNNPNGHGFNHNHHQMHPMEPMPRHMQQSNRGRGQGHGGQGAGQSKRRPQRGMEDKTQRTVYISSIDLKVTEAELATFFLDCGQVLDCRICGDPNSATRFAFIEFIDLDGAERALDKSGVLLGALALRVLPSKTAIVPVKRELMPASQDDLERCGRTVYVTNIDKKVDRAEVRGFFEQLCGKVSKLRLLGDNAHATRIAFVEFVEPEAAMAALNCSGALLGSLPIRVSPSKTPVRSESTAPPQNKAAAATPNAESAAPVSAEQN